MIVGAHTTIPSKNENADKAFFRDVLKLPNVDAGGGYVIFGLPPCEVAIHDGQDATGHTLHLMCADIRKFLDRMGTLGIAASPARSEVWGMMTEITLPGGGTLSVYQPTHKHPKHPAVGAAKKAKPAKKTPARKKVKAKKAKSKAKKR
ncbi:MAG: extradiol dioxygenase [Alphaproteobacteria bacterium]|nr:extradiol dioxygenase [Alphaproteobacteria bacterium]MDE2109978.1 extradiol dioxygenase [Alphaproteobacteria bacterium]MDE2494423.1 extradiol dioxygenase [Alphaproteobacteria bacterium]